MKKKQSGQGKFPERIDRSTWLNLVEKLGRPLFEREVLAITEAYQRNCCNHWLEAGIATSLLFPQIRDESGRVAELTGRVLAIDRYSSEYGDTDVEWRVCLDVAFVGGESSTDC